MARTVNCKICKHSILKSKKESFKQYKERVFCGFECFGKYQKVRMVGAGSPMKGRKHTVQSKLLNSIAHKKVDPISRTKGYRRVKCLERYALSKGAVGRFTHEEWVKIKDVYGCRCAICHRSEIEVKLTIDHIVPLTKGGTNWPSNLQPLCQPCNSRKGNRI